jgi:hypothetical protein
MNNTELDFPAIMNDARALTDYRSSCVNNLNSIEMDSLTYRNTLQENGMNQIREERKRIEEYMTCKSCPDYTIIEPNIIQSCNERHCDYQSIHKNGLGLINDNSYY